jgi:hypothetical protein
MIRFPENGANAALKPPHFRRFAKSIAAGRRVSVWSAAAPAPLFDQAFVTL